MKIPEFKIRTDLALEEREGLKEAAEEVSGVSFKKWEGKRSAAQITEVKVLNEHGAKALGKPMGSYLTLEADKLLMPDEDFHSEVSDELALLLKGLLKQKTGKNILVFKGGFTLPWLALSLDASASISRSIFSLVFAVTSSHFIARTAIPYL